MITEATILIDPRNRSTQAVITQRGQSIPSVIAKARKRYPKCKILQLRKHIDKANQSERFPVSSGTPYEKVQYA